MWGAHRASTPCAPGLVTFAHMRPVTRPAISRRPPPQVFGDYGAGPNHVLPTSGTARFTGGLSVFTFLVRKRARSWVGDRGLAPPRDALGCARLQSESPSARPSRTPPSRAARAHVVALGRGHGGRGWRARARRRHGCARGAGGPRGPRRGEDRRLEDGAGPRRRLAARERGWVEDGGVGPARVPGGGVLRGDGRAGAQRAQSGKEDLMLFLFFISVL